jgi:hypothetical protein
VSLGEDPSRSFDALDELDDDRLRRLSSWVQTLADADVASQCLPPGIPPEVISTLESRWRFDHAGILLFPPHMDAVHRRLDELGYRPQEPIRSMVVRRRLARRHGIDPALLDVVFLDARLRSSELDRGLEVFALPRHVRNLPHQHIQADERLLEHESHVAFRVSEPTPEVVHELITLLDRRPELRPEGGGVNLIQDRDRGGRSVFYYRHRRPGPQARFTRIEVTCTGSYPELSRAHELAGAATDFLPSTRTPMVWSGADAAGKLDSPMLGGGAS